VLKVLGLFGQLLSDFTFCKYFVHVGCRILHYKIAFYRLACKMGTYFNGAKYVTCRFPDVYMQSNNIIQ